jgi:glycosyltransferase involved in cell wall biosynthesis
MPARTQNGRRVRVCHVVGSALSVRELLLDQLVHLRDHGFDVAIASPLGPELEAVHATGITCHPVAVGRKPSLGNPLAVAKLALLFRRCRFDIVHTHNPLAGLLGRSAARLAGSDHIVHTVHGWHFSALAAALARQQAVRAERIAARFTDLLLFQSRDDQETARLLGLDKRTRLKFIGNGIDLGRFDPRSSVPVPGSIERQIAGAGLIVAFVGRISHPRKGYLDFLAASRLLAASPGHDYRFLTVGALDEKASPDVRAALESARQDGRHVVMDWIPNHVLPSLYRRMDVLVLPSLFEGLPRVVMEASVMGVPVVATDVTGNREALPPFPPNELVPFGDPSALASAISRVISWRGEERRPAESARRWARDRFDQRKVFDVVARTYEDLLYQRETRSDVSEM